MFPLPGPGRGLQDRGDGLPAHPGNGNHIRLFRPYRRKAVSQPEGDPLRQAVPGSRLARPLQGPLPQIGGNRLLNYTLLQQPDREPGVVGPHVGKACAPGHLTGQGQQPRRQHNRSHLVHLTFCPRISQHRVIGTDILVMAVLHPKSAGDGAQRLKAQPLPLKQAVQDRVPVTIGSYVYAHFCWSRFSAQEKAERRRRSAFLWFLLHSRQHGIDLFQQSVHVHAVDHAGLLHGLAAA